MVILLLRKRKESWQLLCMIEPTLHIHWLCMGDFNEILSNEEKFGAASKSFSQMERFREALEDCELSNLGYKGSKYTWSNKREGSGFTKEMIDRALGNSVWPLLYENTDINVCLCYVLIIHLFLYLVLVMKGRRLLTYTYSDMRLTGLKRTSVNKL